VVRIKIDGKDIDRNARVTFETTEYSDGMAYVIILIGGFFIYLIAKGGLFA
jgi:TctA family transporter